MAVAVPAARARPGGAGLGPRLGEGAEGRPSNPFRVVQATVLLSPDACQLDASQRSSPRPTLRVEYPGPVGTWVWGRTEPGRSAARS